MGPDIFEQLAVDAHNGFLEALKQWGTENPANVRYLASQNAIQAAIASGVLDSKDPDLGPDRFYGTCDRISLLSRMLER